MRDIKFRMWHKESKKIFDVEKINIKDKLINMWNIQFYLSSVFGLDEVELMQFTGLYDKNGREIYEWDIISNGTEKCLVVWIKEQAGFMLKLLNEEFENEEWTNPMIDLRKDLEEGVEEWSQGQ